LGELASIFWPDALVELGDAEGRKDVRDRLSGFSEKRAKTLKAVESADAISAGGTVNPPSQGAG
jgi:hypothetical protein